MQFDYHGTWCTLDNARTLPSRATIQISTIMCRRTTETAPGKPAVDADKCKAEVCAHSGERRGDVSNSSNSIRHIHTQRVYRCIIIMVMVVFAIGVSLAISSYARQALLQTVTSSTSCGDVGGGMGNNGNFVDIMPPTAQNAARGNETASSLVTFLFLIGVEGSGHHLWGSVYDSSPSFLQYREAKRSGLMNEPFNDLASGLHSLFTAGCIAENETEVGHNSRSMKNSTYSGTQAIDLVVRSMKRMKAALRQTHGPRMHTTVALNAHFQPRRKKLFSYPFGAYGGCRAVSYPDLGLLYRACESARVDCKHILLSRDAHEVIRSTTINRHFSEIENQIKTLSSMLGVLRTQNMDHYKKLAACWNYDTSEGVDEISELLGWKSKEEFRSSFADLFHQPQALKDNERNEIVPSDLDYLMKTMERQTNQLADECRILVQRNRR